MAKGELGKQPALNKCLRPEAARDPCLPLRFGRGVSIHAWDGVCLWLWVARGCAPAQGAPEIGRFLARPRPEPSRSCRRLLAQALLPGSLLVPSFIFCSGLPQL